MEKIGRQRRSESVWQEIVARQTASGLTVQSFCEREGINAASLYGWRSRLREGSESKRAPRQVIKRRDSQAISCPPAPQGVIEGSRADVSFAAGLVIDKFAYHLPLYRQHQRLTDSGIQVSRPWLTQVTQQVISLLEPVYEAQFDSIRSSRVKAMDETPIKAGRTGHGKMKLGYFWPVYGGQDEVCFPFFPSRHAEHVRAALGVTHATDAVLLTDGYAAYHSYAKKIGITHAQCWSHCPESSFIWNGCADTAEIPPLSLRIAPDNNRWRVRGTRGRRADRALVTKGALASARVPIAARSVPRRCASSAGSWKRIGSSWRCWRVPSSHG